MLFAVIIGPAAGDRAEPGWSVEERGHFLDSLKSERRLLLEGTYGDDGSLLVIDAPSTHEALAWLHDDPYALACGRVQIRPLVVNYVEPLEATNSPAGDSQGLAEGAGNQRRRIRIGSSVTVLPRRREGGSG